MRRTFSRAVLSAPAALPSAAVRRRWRARTATRGPPRLPVVRRLPCRALEVLPRRAACPITVFSISQRLPRELRYSRCRAAPVDWWCWEVRLLLSRTPPILFLAVSRVPGVLPSPAVRKRWRARTPTPAPRRLPVVRHLLCRVRAALPHRAVWAITALLTYPRLPRELPCSPCRVASA